MKNKLLIVILIILGLYATKALFHPGFYTSHDGGHQIIRLLHFDQGLKDGQFPVRWAGGAMCGYGYPLYIFTYRLPFWLAEFWYFLSDNLVDSIKFTFIISFILSGLTMYWFASKLWKSKPAGFFTAFLYLWAPYRFVDIFVRAALGEAFAFIFIPLIFLGIYGLAKEKDYLFYFFLLTFSLAGLVLSHTMILVVFIIPIALWFLLFLFKSWNNIKYLITVFFAAIFSLFLSAYYWLPATIERSYIKFAKNFSGYYVNHFATLKQLLYSRWGFGFDMAGVIQDEMSFQVGLAQWCVVGLSLMLIISLIIAHKRNKNNYLSIFLGLIITFVISIVLMIPAADRFYKTINNFFVIDIPWKFLSVSLFAAAVLFGGIIVIINNRYLKWGIIAVVVFLAIYGNRNGRYPVN